MIKALVAGSRGRMGSTIVEMIKVSKDVSLIAELEAGQRIEEYINGADVVIDFTVAKASAHHALVAAEYKKAIVIGTTGLNANEEEAIAKAAKKTAIVKSPNMSAGVNVMWKLIEIAAQTLGKQYKIDIVETHHINKLDRPSGTAKQILDIVLEKSGRSLDRDVFFYEDEFGPKGGRDDMEISVRSIRRGEVVGDHATHFTSPGETLSILHHAATRDVFAEGAITAAKWVVGKRPGLYDMYDVLNLKHV